MAPNNFMNGLIASSGRAMPATDDSLKVSIWYDTGVYALNALLSGSIYKGLAGDRITGFAGESSTGKTFFAMSIAKQFQSLNKNNIVVVYDTEGAYDAQMIESRGLDPKRTVVALLDTVEDVKNDLLKMITYISETKDAPKVMFILDSLGNLSTKKEMADSLEGKEVADMTRAKLLKGTFRVITLKMKKLGCPFIITNHTYQTIGLFSKKEMGGGTGLQYCASQIVFMGKSQIKEDSEVTGANISLKMEKSRLSREKKVISVALDFSKGLNRYGGLLEIAEKYGIFKKNGTRYEMPDGAKVFGSAIERNPEKYYTKEILEKIDAACFKEFAYGAGEEVPPEIVEEEVENDAQE